MHTTRTGAGLREACSSRWSDSPIFDSDRRFRSSVDLNHNFFVVSPHPLCAHITTTISLVCFTIMFHHALFLELSPDSALYWLISRQVTREEEIDLIFFCFYKDEARNEDRTEGGKLNMLSAREAWTGRMRNLLVLSRVEEGWNEVQISQVHIFKRWSS